MLPTAIVAMRPSFRIRSANGVWNMRPYTGCARVEVWPADTLQMSAPASLKARATSTEVSGVMPSSPTQSLAEIRTDIGFGADHAARTAAKTRSGNRMRFSRLPPYRSSRRFVSGVMNEERR